MRHVTSSLRRSLAGRGLPAPLRVALVLMVCTWTQCVCQSARKDTPAHGVAQGGPPARAIAAVGAQGLKSEERAQKIPKVLDIADLDGDEQALLLEVLEEQFDPCGGSVSFLESLNKPKPCAMALEAGDLVVEFIQKGLSKRQIAKQLLKFLARASVVAEFDYVGTAYLGDPASQTVIVEFMDFQCPFCRVVSGEAKELATKHGAVLYIKHLPIEHHEHAHLAARASMAADRQGRFWELYGLLFENQTSLSEEVIRGLAKEAGLDMGRYKKDLESAELEAILKRDEREADRYKVDGTPYFFLNGKPVEFDHLEARLTE